MPLGVHAALPVLDDAARSPDPSVCPFFRREIAGELVVPRLDPDDENRCAAIGGSRPQSLRQQELVCLRATHADCPRYRRGAMATTAAEAPRRRPTVPRATLAALLILVLSAGISFGFVLQRGGIDLPVVAGSPEPTAQAVVASPSPEVTPPAAPAASATATPAPVVTLSPAPGSTPSPAPAPTVAPEPTVAPTRSPAPSPTSTRYALLEPCPDQTGCWIYKVRGGDNLYSIAKYFGHSLDTIYAWNPKYPASRLAAGDTIRMPPPTR